MTLSSSPFYSGVQGVWVNRGTFSGLKHISVEEWSKTDGEAQVEAMGGSVDVGDDYASNFLAIYPQEKLTDGDKKFSVTLKVDSSMSGTVTVYTTSKDTPRQWRKVDAKINEGVALMQVDRGKKKRMRLNTKKASQTPSAQPSKGFGHPLPLAH